MPRTRKRVSTPVEAPEPETQQEEDEEQEEEHALRPLQFEDALTWKAGKPIPVAELLRRLKALHAEIVEIQQEEAHRKSLVPVARELAHANLLNHRDRGIKAWVGLCLVEMFRLLAPDAPFTGGQLKDVFQLFISSIIPSLGNPADPYNDQHLRILTSLDDVKSVVLLSDIPGSDGLLVQLFLNCFDILADTTRADTGEELSKNVEYHMTRMLITLVDESESIVSGVVDTILAQFLRVDPSTLSLQVKKSRGEDRQGMMHLRQLPPAYNMAENICNSCSEKMSRAISQYFSTVIVDASDNALSNKARKTTGKRRRGAEESEDEDLNGPAEPSADDLEDLHKAHRLLRELWRSAPDTIQNIIPQLNAELVAGSDSLRLLATETVGDLISGIGAAGPPPPATLDPAAYPSQSLESASARAAPFNFLTTPASPHAFSSVYSSAYEGFMGRRHDKSAQVRAVWTTRAGRILMTAAGGVGLDADEEASILDYMSEMLVDTDDKVRLAAVQAIARCDFDVIVQRIGAHGAVTEPLSILGRLAERIKDRKHNVRVEAMNLLGRLWGVAAGAIAEGSDRVRTLLGAIPSRVFQAIYINDPEINRLVQQVLYDSLLPLNFPPIKPAQASNGNSQRVRDSQTAPSQTERAPDADAIRAERILVLTRDLEPKAKSVFFMFQKRQVGHSNYMEAFLKRCEEYNGGVTGKDGKEAKALLGKIIDYFARTHPEPLTASENLWKFAKKHDRRCYQLIRFTMSPESDYRKVIKAQRELAKRIGDSAGNTTGILATLVPTVQQCSVLVYNRSHVPTIMEISRTDEKGLGSTAHEVLKEISDNHPEVFKAHVRTMCESLIDSTPKAGAESDTGTVETLKACAGFAQRFPAEMPQDRNFLQSMVKFAVHGSPPVAAKHAVSIVVAVEDKKDMYIKDIVSQCVQGFKYGEDGFLSKLAALSQLMLVAAQDIEDEHDSIISLAIQQVLLQNRVAASNDDPDWTDIMDDDCAAKVWALKILVNRLRYFATATPAAEMEKTVLEMAYPVYKLLRTITEKEGELSKSDSTPLHHKSRLRLTAAILLLKLSGSSKHFDSLLTAKDFIRLATTTQDPNSQVRSKFVDAVKKYLGQGRLPVRFYAMIFLLAFEPTEATKETTFTWLHGRAVAYGKLGENVMELNFARFLSLLAHHPDFSMEVEHLRDFVEYIMFYLKAVASKSNISLIYHVAQRIKSVQDGIDAAMSDNLYCLSDIAQAVIREYVEVQMWSLPAFSGKLGMPSGLFAALPSHAVAQDIADKQYAPEELLDGIEDRVRISLKGSKNKKRKLENSSNQAKKRSKTAGGGSAKKAKIVKTPKKKREREGESSPVAAASERRRSSRKSNAKSYAGMDDSEDDENVEVEDAGEEMQDVEDEEEAEEAADDETDKENVEAEHPVLSRKRGKRQRSTTPVSRPLRGAGKKVTTAAATANGNKAKREVTDIPSDSDDDLSDPPSSEDEGGEV